MEERVVVVRVEGLEVVEAAEGVVEALDVVVDVVEDVVDALAVVEDVVGDVVEDVAEALEVVLLLVVEPDAVAEVV